MANWKKMAQAFGRAMHRPGADPKTVEMIRVKGREYGNPKSDAFNEEVSESFRRGDIEGKIDDDITERLSTTKNPDRLNHDSMSDIDTDINLRADFDKAFNAATGDDTDLRLQLIDELKNGTDISDILIRYGD